MVDIPIEVDTSSATRSLADVGKAAEQGAKNAAKAVEKIADGYNKATVAAERFRQSVIRAEKDSANRERASTQQGIVSRQGSSLDARVAAANLNLASRQNAPLTFGQKLGQGVESVAEGLTSKLGALTTGAAAAAMALTAIKFGLDAREQSNASAGRLSEEMGARRVQLGQAGAAVGMSAEQIAAFQTGDGRMTVSAQESMLHNIGTTAAARPFGMPKLSSATAMKVLDYGQKTGLDLSSVLSNPAVQDGNVDQFLKMELTRRGADVSSLNPSNRRGNATINSYNSKLPPDVAAEQSFQSQLANLEDGPAKERSASGSKRRAADAYLNTLENGSTFEVLNAKFAKIRRWFGDSDVDTEASNDAKRQSEGLGPVIGLLQEANEQRDKTIRPKPPRPTVQRDQ